MSDDDALTLATEDLCDTNSEGLFVRRCMREGFPCFRIPVRKGMQRPDFLVPRVGVFEIKEVAATEGEHQIAQKREPRRMSSKDRHKTVRASISAASRQLRYTKERGLPGIIVLHLQEHVLFNHEDLETCCYGPRLARSIYQRETGNLVGAPLRVAGGGRSLTPRANTRVSAIALLSEYPLYETSTIANEPTVTQAPKLWVLHSLFARVPLTPDKFDGSTMFHSHYEYDDETGLATRVDVDASGKS